MNYCRATKYKPLRPALSRGEPTFPDLEIRSESSKSTSKEQDLRKWPESVPRLSGSWPDFPTLEEIRGE